MLPSKALLFQLFLRQWISAALLQELQNLANTSQWSTSLPFRLVGATEKGMTTPNGLHFHENGQKVSICMGFLNFPARHGFGSFACNVRQPIFD